MQRRMLSHEDEPASGPSEDHEVRREDQDRINAFSRLHQRELGLEEERQAAQKAREDLEEVAGELELVDDEDRIPYRIGDSFVMLPLAEVMELLEKSTERITGEMEVLEGELGQVRGEMAGLKVELYERFGRSINLET